MGTDCGPGARSPTHICRCQKFRTIAYYVLFHGFQRREQRDNQPRSTCPAIGHRWLRFPNLHRADACRQSNHKSLSPPACQIARARTNCRLLSTFHTRPWESGAIIPPYRQFRHRPETCSMWSSLLVSTGLMMPSCCRTQRPNHTPLKSFGQ